MPTSLIAAGLSAGVGAVGNYLSSRTAAAAASHAADLQQQRFNQAAGYEQSYIEGGQRNFNEYNNFTGANGKEAQSTAFNNFQTDPSYTGVLNAGSRAITNSAAARGTLYGGDTLRDVNDYGGNLLQNAYNSRISQLYQGAALGGTAANSLSGAAVQSGANQGYFTQNAGMFTGAGDINMAKNGIAGLNQYSTRSAYNNNALSSSGDPTGNGWGATTYSGNGPTNWGTSGWNPSNWGS